MNRQHFYKDFQDKKTLLNHNPASRRVALVGLDVLPRVPVPGRAFRVDEDEHGAALAHHPLNRLALVADTVKPLGNGDSIDFFVMKILQIIFYENIP